MKDCTYRDGDVIFREGESSDIVYQIVSGNVEIFREMEGSFVALGAVGPGEFLGEMGVLLDAPHSASARASGTVEAVAFARDQFLLRLGGDRESSAALIVRLCERLRLANRQLSRENDAERASLRTPIPGTMTAAPSRPPIDVAVTGPTVRLLPASPQLVDTMPADGVVADSFPFVVGRESRRGSGGNRRKANLAIPDHRPYWLSRAHFAIERQGSDVLVRDLGSALGTAVNGDYLGQASGKDHETLGSGENSVSPGGVDSPFCLKVVVAPEADGVGAT